MHRLLLLLLALSACLPGCAAPPTPQRSVEEVRASGSLRGSDLDGDWVYTSPNRLQPDPALLRRFDHLLTANGETGLPALRRFIEAEVTRLHGVAAATQVLACWDDYLSALKGSTGIDPQTAGNAYPLPRTAPWPARSAPPLPRSLLTPEAPANEEDARSLHAQRVERFGSEAAERLRREDQARWDWARRLEQARNELQNLDAPAREAAVARRFPDARERLRARTLLGLPPG